MGPRCVLEDVPGPAGNGRESKRGNRDTRERSWLESTICRSAPVFEADLALCRRYWSHDENFMLISRTSLASCLADLGRHDEALVLKREIYARRVVISGVSHERTIQAGVSLAQSLKSLELWNEAITLLRDPLLPAARQSLGSDDHVTLALHQNLASALQDSPKCTRDDLLEAEIIMQDVVQRRRRVFGPAHPDTLRAETALSITHARLADA